MVARSRGDGACQGVSAGRGHANRENLGLVTRAAIARQASRGGAAASMADGDPLDPPLAWTPHGTTSSSERAPWKRSLRIPGRAAGAWRPIRFSKSAGLSSPLLGRFIPSALGWRECLQSARSRPGSPGRVPTGSGGRSRETALCRGWGHRKTGHGRPAHSRPPNTTAELASLGKVVGLRPVRVAKTRPRKSRAAQARAAQPACIVSMFFIMTASVSSSSAAGLNITTSVPGWFPTWTWPGGV
jgi:hypothetical protein